MSTTETQSESASKLEARITRDGTLDLCATIDVDEFLADRVEKNEELDAQYVDYCEVLELDRDCHSAKQFALSLDGKGIYSEGEPILVNTYNREDLLSSILQYVYWTDENGSHVLLQIHGGGDVRGNYPPPDAYDVADYNETSIFDNAYGTICCNACDKYWATDDGCHWSCDSTDRKNLEDYDAQDYAPEYNPKPDPLQNFMAFFSGLPQQKDTGIVWVDDDKQAHCPFCGGILHFASQPAG